jgi:hypothetical protein
LDGGWCTAEGTENIFLLEICLWFGSLVIFLNTLDSLARVALLIAVRHAVQQFRDRFLVLIFSPQNLSFKKYGSCLRLKQGCNKN